MDKDFEIQILKSADLKHLAPLTPDGWGDFTLVYQDHINQDYFFPIKLIHENKIIGVSELIICGNVGWVGNIVVDKAFRNKGLGKKLTVHLIEMAKQKKCTSIYLLSTPLGKYVYEKLNFKKNGQYLFFSNPNVLSCDYFYNNIIPYVPKYKEEVLQLDQEAMGEDEAK